MLAPYALMLLGQACIALLNPTTAVIFLLLTTSIGGIVAASLLKAGKFSLSINSAMWNFFTAIIPIVLVVFVFFFFVRNSGALVRVGECLMPCLWSGTCALYFVTLRNDKDEVFKWMAFLAVAFIGFGTCLAVWYIGARDFGLSHPNIERFPYTFAIWEREPASKHWFLIFDLRGERFEEGNCYHGYSIWFAFTYYIPLKIIKTLYGIRYEQGIRYMPLIHGFMLAKVLAAFFAWSFACVRSRRVLYLALSMIGTILTLSVPDFWIGPLGMDGECSFPLIIIFHLLVAGIVLSGKFEIVPMWRLIYYIVLSAFGLFVPIHAALFGLALFTLALAKPCKEYFYGATVLIGIALLSYVAAYPAAYFAGLTVKGAPFLIRSGLDGDSRYFDSIFQAFWSPRMQNRFRAYSFVKFGVVGWFLATIGQCFCPQSSRIGLVVWLLFGGVMLDLIIFPQAHSIHPYFYDIPVAVLGVICLVSVSIELQQRGKESLERWYPLLICILGACVLHNFSMLLMFFKSKP